MHRLSLFITVLAFCAIQTMFAQPARQLIDVRVVPSTSTWEAKTGENVSFTISVIRDEVEFKGVDISYEFGPEKMTPTKKESKKYDGSFKVNAGTLKQPGFLTCKAIVTYNGKSYTGQANVAFDPHRIEAVAKMPADFEAFWEGEKAKMKDLPLDAIVTPMPKLETVKSNVYHVSFQNHKKGSRIYGILSVPKAPGKYPAILNVPGAGVRPYQGAVYHSDAGYIALEIGIHGIPVNMEQEVYSSLFAAGLDKYWLQNLDDRNEYYYKRVYLATVRAVDYIFSLPEFDGKSLAVSGGSQGGALSIIAAALDSRIKCYTAFYPALCDLTGYLHGRAAGWPAMFRYEKSSDQGVAKKAEVSAYYDVVNFARIVKTPGFYSWGYNDTVCPPTSMYAAYNAVTGAKQLTVYPETEHWNYPEQWDEKQAFIKNVFTEK